MYCMASYKKFCNCDSDLSASEFAMTDSLLMLLMSSNGKGKLVNGLRSEMHNGIVQLYIISKSYILECYNSRNATQRE